MAEIKTKKNDASVDKFLGEVEDATKRNDCLIIAGMMEKATGQKPKMWGSSIVGFGEMRYKYASGREGDWPVIAFSPRKQNISVYLTCDINLFSKELDTLGKYKTGVGCLYIKKLEDVDLKVLKNMFIKAVKAVK
ncbi:MAG TPA: DUF1801 domain-containing protein [Ignavibacteriaceae bacterium]|jgi:hypothetical protein|nr:DUF1801 domain-containing protein [Ignavibacteriaceae bacterium]HOJ17515.1 DUF1801 domain-containing protein [Ignavibacteriaceae bacterium]